jgi:hypothetical protein
MGSRFVLSLGTVVALATAFVPRAEAQTANPVTVCRNGTRVASNDSHVCDRNGGVDFRTTAIARHDEEVRAQNARDAAMRAQNNGQYNGDDRYGRNNNGTYNNGTYGDRDDRDDRYDRHDHGRWEKNHDNNGRWGDRGNNGRYSNSPREVYRWAGYVDREVRIQLQGGNAYVQPMGNHEPSTGRGQTLGGLPHQDGVIRVERIEGRGQVDVIEQPNASNGYTATLRVRDPNSGAAPYRIVAYWQPLNNGRYGRN